MSLVAMYSADRDALLCDLAETYHIYDFRALPVKTLAVLSVGLRSDSRIKSKIAEMDYISPNVMLASVADNLSLIRYYLTAKKNDAAPKLYTDMILGNKEKASDVETFASGEEFERARQRLLERM